MFKTLLTAFMLTFSVSVSAVTASGEEDAIMIHEPWAKVSFKNGAAYMIVHNGDTYATELVRVTSPIAKRIELHNVVKENGVFKMIALGKNGITIPAGEKVVLEPNGYHIMVFGIEKSLKEGDTLPLVLHFYGGAPERNARKEINVVVKPINHKMDHSGHNHEH